MSLKDRVLAFKNNKAAQAAAAAELTEPAPEGYLLNTPQDHVDESPAVQVPEGTYGPQDTLVAVVCEDEVAGDDEVFFDEYAKTPVQSFVIKAKNVHITLNISTKA